MRRVLLLSALTALVAAAIVGTAAAQTVTRFSVIATQTSSHRTDNGFVSRGRLTKSGRVVGRYHARFTPRGHHRVKINALARFRGEGSLKAQGVEGPGDNRIPIIGGTRAFDGAAGKLQTNGIGHGRTRLTFTFVQ
jgi:hypothetical protein